MQLVTQDKNQLMLLMAENVFTDMPDTELVTLCQTQTVRDDRPFRELIRRHQKTVWRVCYNFLNNAQDAEDLTQEVFFKAYRNLHQFQGRSSFKTWIYRIAINTSQNELRRRSRRPQESQTPLETAAEFLPSSVTLDDQWRERATRETLKQALLEIRPEEREVILLKDLEERPYAEIAELLGISLSAAKMRVQRARIALRLVYSRLADMEKQPS